jgi:hypothetical protein
MRTRTKDRLGLERRVKDVTSLAACDGALSQCRRAFQSRWASTLEDALCGSFSIGMAFFNSFQSILCT